MSAGVVTHKVELANKIVAGRAVGNLYGVGRYVDGCRVGWALEPQPNEKTAHAFAEIADAALAIPSPVLSALMAFEARPDHHTATALLGALITHRRAILLLPEWTKIALAEIGLDLYTRGPHGIVEVAWEYRLLLRGLPHALPPRCVFCAEQVAAGMDPTRACWPASAKHAEGAVQP